MNKHNKWSISWTQPYSNWKSPIDIFNKETIILTAIDNIVEQMTAYPEVGKIIKQIS
jgi:hypothetical protein